MTNENEQKIESEELVEPEAILGDNNEDLTDWKALALKNYGMAKRYQSDLKKIKELETKAKTETLEAKQPQDKKEFDLAEKSYLLANGIKKNEFQLVFDEMKSSGKSIDEILESKYFQEKREFNASKEAIPPGTKRSGGAAKDDVDYWVSQGKFPPNTPENTELRRKIVKVLAKNSERKNKFSPRPIV